MALAKPTTHHAAGAALPAEGRAVLPAAEGIQRWPELTATCSRALLLSPSCPSLEWWFPADHAALRLKEGLPLSSGVVGKDIQK